MLIINQWATEAVAYITDDIKVENELNGEKSILCLYINGDCYAKLEDESIMDSLQYRLHSFIDRSKRTTDTFDIGAEIDMIRNGKPQLVYG